MAIALKCANSRVAFHLFTGSLAGLGKLPAFAGWYIRFDIFVMEDLAGASICEILQELLFVNSAGTFFSLKRGLGPSKRGQKPPFEGNKRFLPNV
jgi:hypothetical protein